MSQRNPSLFDPPPPEATGLRVVCRKCGTIVTEGVPPNQVVDTCGSCRSTPRAAPVAAAIRPPRYFGMVRMLPLDAATYTFPPQGPEAEPAAIRLLYDQSRRTSTRRVAENLRKMRVSLHCWRGWVFLTLARKERRISDTEILNARTVFGIPGGAVRCPPTGLQSTIISGSVWYDVCYAWWEPQESR